MTAGELIEKLREFPPGTPVWAFSQWDDDADEVGIVEQIDTYRFGVWVRPLLLTP